jgi:hypothetical protein
VGSNPTPAAAPISTLSADVLGSTSERLLVPGACGLLALILATATLVPALRPEGWSVTALPRVGAGTPMGQAATTIDPSFRLVDQGAYDGQFYWGIAVDPIARGSVHDAFDTASYRYGHPLFGWLGWIASAGQASAAAPALLVVGLLALLAAAAASAALAIAVGRSGVEGLFVALNPGLLYAAAHDLAEPLCAALLLLALNGYLRGRRALTLTSLALLPLAKEQLVLVPLALAAWELVRRAGRVAEAALLVATVVPAVVWWTYARLTLGAWFTSGDTALGAPFVGWARALADNGVNSYDVDPGRNQLGEAAIIVLVVLLGLLALVVLRALRLRSQLDLVYLALAAVAACLAPIATVLPRDALRNTAVLLTLVPFVGARYSPRWST